MSITSEDLGIDSRLNDIKEALEAEKAEKEAIEKELKEIEKLFKEELEREENDHLDIIGNKADLAEEKRLEEEAKKAAEEAKKQEEAAKAAEEAKRLEEEAKKKEAEEEKAVEEERKKLEESGILTPHYIYPQGYDSLKGRRHRNFPNYLDNAQEMEYIFPDYISSFKRLSLKDLDVPDFKPDIEDIVSKYDKDLDKLLDDFANLESEIPDTEYMSDALVTDTTLNGYGFYDILTQSYINKLDHVRGLCGIGNKEFFDYVARTLPTFAQVACTYALGKEQARVQARQIEAQNLAIKAQILETKSRAMLIKAQLESVGYDNAIKEQQVIAGYYEVEKAKAELPAVYMNQELIHENILNAQHQNQKALLEHQLIKRQILSEQAMIQDIVDGKPVEGKVGAEKHLAETQALSYERDAHVKFLELFITAWQTKKAGDNAILSPTVFSSLVIDKLSKSVGVKLFDLDPQDLDIPDNWKEYMDEEELSGKKTPSQFTVTK